uniref:Sin3a_C domain-containing protein n=1 Tax=Strongyloides venezuelensis TaxID=75913 RepID=A0A0K0FXL6_STRVS
MTISDVKNIFRAFNSGSSVHKGVKPDSCTYMVDLTFDLELALAFSRYFVDDTDFGATEVLRMPSCTDFQSSNNIRMFSIETITTSHLKRTLTLSNYEPFEDRQYFFKNMTVNVIKKSVISYLERKKESDVYFNIYRSVLRDIFRHTRRTTKKKLADEEEAKKIFEDKESMKSFSRCSAYDAKDVLAVLELLLASYTENAVIEAIGVSMDFYEKGYELLQKRSKGIFPDADSEISQKFCVVDKTTDFFNTYSCKENEALPTDCDMDEPLLKKTKTLHDEINVDGEDISLLNKAFRGSFVLNISIKILIDK